MILFRIQVEVRVHPAHVELACSGKYSRSEAFRVAEQAFKEAAGAGRRNVLLDVRGVSGRVPTILDRFDLAVHIARLQTEHTPRIRVALLGQEPMIHADRFGEIVARNRGADVRVFTVEAHALDWLTAA